MDGIIPDFSHGPVGTRSPPIIVNLAVATG